MKKNNFKSLIIVVSLIITFFSFAVILLKGQNEESVRVLIRWTAKLSGILFAIAFGVSSFQFLFKDRLSKIALKFRPHIGLSFGVFHTFHLFFLMWLQSSIHPVFTLAKTSSLIGGGLAYVFMYLMMITTFPYFKSRLTTNQWKWLHLIGGYWIWLIFFRSYMMRVINNQENYFLFALMLFLIILRVIHFIIKNKKALHPSKT